MAGRKNSNWTDEQGRTYARAAANEAGVTYVMCHLAFGDLPLTASLSVSLSIA
jgi:hypothetical protein